MRKIMSWMLAAIFICGASVLNSCKDAHAQEDNPAPQVVSTELIRTSQSWDGEELPDYFQGRPELVAVKYVFPAGARPSSRWSAPYTTARTAARRTASSTCSISRRRTCPSPCSIRRFRWSKQISKQQKQ